MINSQYVVVMSFPGNSDPVNTVKSELILHFKNSIVEEN